MKKLVLSCILLSTPFFGSDVKWDKYQTTDEVIIPCLEGIALLGNWEQVRKNSVDAGNQIAVNGIHFLEKNPQFVSELQTRYVGKALTQGQIAALKNDIVNFYSENHQHLVVVSIPKQTVDNGVLQVVVEEPRLGKVTVRGNCYFPTRWFSETMRVCPGEPIDPQMVLEDVAWLNLNPFRRTDAIYKPGDKPGLVDIELVSIDRWPARVYMGADNTGTVETNRNRLFFGFNFGKSVLKDGQISYQFTFAPNWNLYYSHTASARLPLPWRHIWVLWGGYASVQPHMHVPNSKNQGISWQVDTRYRIPYLKTPNLMQTFVLGYDFKETDNNLLYNNSLITNTVADINQFMLGYEVGYRNPRSRAFLTAEIYGNPGGITHANQTDRYQALRFDAKDTYLYIRAAHSFATEFQVGWFTYNLAGQVSTANLLPSEQMTMTGYNAVRGFEERILNLDNALIANVAYETPHWSLIRAIRGCGKRWDEFYLIAFFDAGMGANHRNIPGQPSFMSLGSIGPGVRWQADRFFTAHFDYGIQLWSSGFYNPSHSRYNFGMILSY